MKLLLITFSFPPAGGVGVLRALSLAKYLPENEVEVHVLTARNAPAVGRDDSLLAQVPASVHIHRTWTLDLPFALRKAFKSLLSRSATSSTTTATAPSAPGILGRIRSSVADMLLPDPQVGWLPFAIPAARRLIRQHNIDAVLITVPPFSTLRCARALRTSFPQLPIVVDFRDEWLTTTLGLVSFSKSSRARDIAQQTESDSVHAATAVVAVTRNAVDELRKRYPQLPADKFVYIPNGYDNTAPQQHTPSGDRITLTYIGSVYGSTDPTSFLTAVASLPPEIKDQLRIRFIGRVETDALRRILEAQSPTVELTGFLPQAEALRQLHASHYALLITHDPVNVSAKFYDYLGSGIPIVAAVHPHGEVRRMIDETNAGTWANIDDPSAIRAMLLDLVANRSFTHTPTHHAIAAFHRRPLAAQYAALLKDLACASR